MSRLRLCEVLSSLANRPITERDFVISDPVVVEGVRTAVMIEPRNRSRCYGFQRVEYKRIDLSERASIEIAWKGEQNTHQLLERATMISHFPYRLLRNDGTNNTYPRRLRLQAEDIIYESIFANTNRTVVILRAAENSDFFIGSWKVTLVRTA